ncbi:hypothetical protein JCGZ_15443 [Jatropha curcas]|uniref:Aminotransferase-like plant mobile domain-containing protein n=1 Tax=Jatropha curcas TaxID=180498 RepID=A0A067K8Z4_JATCU|nr:hypothetical protein JCGZ_15443 [Jatropha curcas]
MSQILEIPASAYTTEMETLGALLDIPTFDGEPVHVSRNPLMPGTRLLQLLPLPGTEFPVRYETSRMRSFQSELFFGRTVPCCDCSSARQSLEQWRDATVEMRAAAFELRDASVLRTPNFEQLRDAAVEWHGAAAEMRNAAVWSYEYRIYPGGPSRDTPIESRRIPRYLAHCHHTYASGEDPEYWQSFLNDRELSDLFLTPWDCEAWRVFDTPVAPAQRRVPHAPPRHMCLLEGLTRADLEVEYRGFSANDFLSVGDFPAYFASRMQARL